MSGKAHRFATEEIEKFTTVDLIAELKRRYQVLSRPERSCVLLGPAYSGLSTQAAFLRKEWGLCSISREDILPEDNSSTIETGMTKLSQELNSFRCRRGFALTRFPSSASEAEALDDLLGKKHPHKRDYKVIVFQVPEDDSGTDLLSNRAKGHLIHENSGRIYNSNVPELMPQTPYLDDITGDPLVGPQWKISNVEEKITQWWNTQLPSVAKYYGSKIRTINATESRDSVSVEISKLLLNSESTEEKM